MTKATILERLSRNLLPVWFFAGVAIGFSLSMWAGKWASRRTLYADRSRFFFKVSPAGYVYPTIENLSHFVWRKAPKDKTLVLVGGSSVLLGVGQHEKVLWTKALQEKLGPNFAVVNIAFRGATFTSIGMPMAEILSRGYAHWYYVSDLSTDYPQQWLYNPASDNPYRYVVWRTWLGGRLLPNPGRDAELKGLLFDNREETRLLAREDALGALFEIGFRASSLWNYVGDTYFFPAYSALLPPDVPFWTPRKELGDDEFGASRGMERFTTHADFNMKRLYSLIYGGSAVDKTTRAANIAQHERSIESLKAIVTDPTMRRHTLFLLPSVCPYFIERLSIDEKATYVHRYLDESATLDEEGFNVIPVGLNYTSDDYVDYVHFSDSGAPKLAEEVAVKLRSMSESENGGDSKGR